jgi:hypothetical protein
MYYNFAADMELQREIRVPVTRLRDYLNEVGLTVTALAELSGIGTRHLQKCLVGEVDQRNGAVRTMSDENMALLQDALHRLAVNLKYLFIFYNPELEVVKRSGNRYCKDCVYQIKEQLSPYFNVLPFMMYALGWNRSKVRNVMDIEKGIAFGNISQDDVNTVNLKLAEVSTRLDLLTIVR